MGVEEEEISLHNFPFIESSSDFQEGEKPMTNNEVENFILRRKKRSFHTLAVRLVKAFVMNQALVIFNV